MKKKISGILVLLGVISIFLFGFNFLWAGAAERVQYGGSINFPRTTNPISWDIVDWVAKHPTDTGFYMEHLMMGDLQKGPRGTKEYAFTAEAWILPGIQRGELLERWEVKKNPLYFQPPTSTSPGGPGLKIITGNYVWDPSGRPRSLPASGLIRI